MAISLQCKKLARPLRAHRPTVLSRALPLKAKRNSAYLSPSRTLTTQQRQMSATDLAPWPVCSRATHPPRAACCVRSSGSGTIAANRPYSFSDLRNITTGSASKRFCSNAFPVVSHCDEACFRQLYPRAPTVQRISAPSDPAFALELANPAKRRRGWDIRSDAQCRDRDASVNQHLAIQL